MDIKQMKTLKTAIALSVLASATACAKPPGRIQPLAYATNCPVNAAQRLDELSKVQQSAATNDALGVFLIGLPLGSMGGSDNEAEIARLKACVNGPLRKAKT